MANAKGLSSITWYYQVLIVSAICGGLLALLWYQYLAPIQADIHSKNAQLAELKSVIAKSLEQQKILAQIKMDCEELQAKLEKLRAILPLAKETDEVLRAVQRAASSSALKILRVGSRPIIDHDIYTEWPIDMEIIGTYHNVGAYLDRIRQLPRIVNISGLRLVVRAPAGEASFTSSVGASYTATTFVYREDPAETAPPKPVK